jgi:hypothetical protein
LFDNLSTRLAAVVEGLRGRGRLTEENIGDTLRQVRMALLEADVALPVVKEFIDAVKVRAVGTEVHNSLTPGQALVRVIHEELVRVMGEGVRPLNLRTQPPAIILLAGLQSIPRDLEEALRLEGAGDWTVLRRLQWPLLSSYVTLALLFRLAQAFGVFDLIQLLTGGGPAGSTESLASYAYLQAMRFLDFGYSATLMLATFLMVLTLSLLWLGGVRWSGARR